jgi:hypothetical protein
MTTVSGLPSPVTAATPTRHDCDHDGHQQHDDGGEMQGGDLDDKRRQACHAGIRCASVLARRQQQLGHHPNHGPARAPRRQNGHNIGQRTRRRRCIKFLIYALRVSERKVLTGMGRGGREDPGDRFLGVQAAGRAAITRAAPGDRQLAARITICDFSLFITQPTIEINPTFFPLISIDKNYSLNLKT